MTITLRLAGPGDLATVQEIVRAAYNHYIARIGREPGPMFNDYATLPAVYVHLMSVFRGACVKAPAARR
ncbi:hypothetical protein [Methylocapsa palsarum]|nr:hypothetical protein [Methylocapsa palsarum]